jgi:hypothetical protein
MAKKVLKGWKKSQGQYTYFFKPTTAKFFKIKKICFFGFKEQPAGLALYKTGGGFNMRMANKVGGSILLRYLYEKFKKEIKLNIYKNTINQIIEGKKAITVKVSFKSFLELLTDLGNDINRNKSRIIYNKLTQCFPDKFKTNSDSESVDSKLFDINLNKLNKDDHDAISRFIKKYLSGESNNQTFKKLQTDLIIQGHKKTLDQVIKKFEKHLTEKFFDEKKWQKFLHSEVFFFMSNYVESIREANVNFGKTDEGEKKPDFVWIDLYGFLDVFEIKTPFTEILCKRIDGSHKNYYFSSSASKAISQIEKYIMFLEKNVEGFEKYLSCQTKIQKS